MPDKRLKRLKYQFIAKDLFNDQIRSFKSRDELWKFKSRQSSQYLRLLEASMICMCCNCRPARITRDEVRYCERCYYKSFEGRL